MSDNVSLAVGGAIAGAAVVKLIIYDLSAISGLPRAFAFIACGLILLGVVALRRSCSDRRNPQRVAPAATDGTSSVEPQPAQLGAAAPEAVATEAGGPDAAREPADGADDAAVTEAPEQPTGPGEDAAAPDEGEAEAKPGWGTPPRD
ncbi:hypothetical protein [Corynebacterium frankenforstense]